MRYLAITPARDEEAFLPGMIASMVAQTILPARWIIIDDGSEDRTAEIIDEAAREHPWIVPKHLPQGRKREAGGESVIMRFLAEEAWQALDFIVRFDSDLIFESDYIERLLAQFERDPKLGIASGTLVEPVRGEWKPIILPSFHTRGASKIYSRDCFTAIGGLEAGQGWDTIDEVRAMMNGFHTRSFRDVIAYHRRPAGGSLGALKQRLEQGKVAYYLGYSPVYAVARSVSLLFRKPRVLGSFKYLEGFCSSYLSGAPQVNDRQFVKFIRTQQLRRLTFRESVWQ